MSLIQNDPLAHKDAQFINVLYYTPVGNLLQMDKEHLRHCLAKAQLVCHWLEGILDLVIDLEEKEK